MTEFAGTVMTESQNTGVLADLAKFTLGGLCTGVLLVWVFSVKLEHRLTKLETQIETLNRHFVTQQRAALLAPTRYIEFCGGPIQ